MAKLKINTSSPVEVGPMPTSADDFITGAAQAKATTSGRGVKPVRVNFDLEFETHRRLKIRAAEKGISVSNLVRNMIESELRK